MKVTVVIKTSPSKFIRQMFHKVLENMSEYKTVHFYRQTKPFRQLYLKGSIKIPKLFEELQSPHALILHEPPSFFRLIHFVTFRHMSTQYINNWGLDLHERFYIVSALLMLAVLQMFGELMHPQGNIWNSSVLC